MWLGVSCVCLSVPWVYVRPFVYLPLCVSLAPWAFSGMLPCAECVCVPISISVCLWSVLTPEGQQNLALG